MNINMGHFIPKYGPTILQRKAIIGKKENHGPIQTINLLLIYANVHF